MKLFCFVILFFFVNVSTNQGEYKKLVAIANAHIKLAVNMNCTVENFIISGLELVIQEMAKGPSIYSISKLNLSIAVPEKTEIVAEIDKSKQYQRMVSQDIEHFLSIPTPTTGDDEDIGKDLITLGKERRVLTGNAVKNVIRNVIDCGNVYSLIEERRMRTGQNSSNRITSALRGYVFNISFTAMCRLIAILMTIKHPSDYIKHYEIANDGTCTLWDGNKFKKYDKIEGIWWKVNVNDITQKLKQLKTQL